LVPVFQLFPRVLLHLLLQAIQDHPVHLSVRLVLLNLYSQQVQADLMLHLLRFFLDLHLAQSLLSNLNFPLVLDFLQVQKPQGLQ